MKVSSVFSQRVVSLVVAIALLGAPGLPAMASAPMDATAHAAHAAHAAHGAVGADATALHVNHGKAGEMTGAEGPSTTGCAQHDQCSGKCCAGCAQCFTAAFNFSSVSTETYSIQFPTVLHLDDRLTVAAHNRPPAA